MYSIRRGRTKLYLTFFYLFFMTRIILYSEVPRNEYKVIILRTLPTKQ